MAIELNDNIKVLAPKPSDSRSLTETGALYSTVAQVNSIIPSTQRHLRLTVNLPDGEYWYRDGIADINLVKKTQDTSLSSVTSIKRDEFTRAGNQQIFTLTDNFYQVFSVEVQGQGALSSSQYNLLIPNRIEIVDSLNDNDYIVVIYGTDLETTNVPYYTQAQIDSLLLNDTPGIIQRFQDLQELP